MRGSGPEEVFWGHYGRLAQRESTALTTQGSAVRTRHRPRNERPGQRSFSSFFRYEHVFKRARNPTKIQHPKRHWINGGTSFSAKSNKSNTEERRVGMAVRRFEPLAGTERKGRPTLAPLLIAATYSLLFAARATSSSTQRKSPDVARPQDSWRQELAQLQVLRG